MFKTIVHQTLEDRDNPDYIENFGPFPAEEIHDLFLGHGYYFWDDHLNLAHWWGEVHCRSKYVICEGDFNIDLNDFLDLVGSRQDMKYYQELIEIFNIRHLPIGAQIEYLKDKNSRPDKEGLFPYKAIRAVEDSGGSYKQEWFQFVIGKPGRTSLMPKYIICLIKKSNVLLQNYRIVYPEYYCQD